MIGHAAAAEWLRTLPWWDWRGWSDWFYGGQAIGVNYPPLGHAWMRFTHPVHGQMAAVALGLIVLLPWGALRLARAVGYSPRVQRAAVAAVCVLTAAAGEMHWVLSGFHSERTFFGSWPAMLSTVIGLHVATWAARCRRPVASGALAGVAVLFNATVIPGVGVVCVALLATSMATTRQACRWMVTAAAAAVAVSAWWLVPFIAGWERLVRWEMPLHGAWDAGGNWQAGLLAVVGVLAAWAARTQGGPARRLAIAALSALFATVMADLLGYLRSERWLELANPDSSCGRYWTSRQPVTSGCTAASASRMDHSLRCLPDRVPRRDSTLGGAASSGVAAALAATHLGLGRGSGLGRRPNLSATADSCVGPDSI